MAGGAWPTGCSIYGKGVWFYFCDVHIWAKGGVSWGKHVYGWQKQGVAARLPYMGKGAWPDVVPAPQASPAASDSFLLFDAAEDEEGAEPMGDEEEEPVA